MIAVARGRPGRRCQRRRSRTHAESASTRANWQSRRGGVFNTTPSSRNEVGKIATRGVSYPRFNCVQQPPVAVEQIGGGR